MSQRELGQRTIRRSSFTSQFHCIYNFCFALLFVPLFLRLCFIRIRKITRHSLTKSVTKFLTHSLTRSLAHSLTHAITHSLTNSRNHSLTHFHPPSFTHSLPPPSLAHENIHLLAPSFTPRSRNHSLPRSLPPSLTPRRRVVIT